MCEVWKNLINEEELGECIEEIDSKVLNLRRSNNVFKYIVYFKTDFIAAKIASGLLDKLFR